MMDSSKKESGELSPEESAIAKKIFMAIGFLGIAIVIIALDTYLPIEYVLTVVVIAGLAVVALAERQHPAHPQDKSNQ